MVPPDTALLTYLIRDLFLIFSRKIDKMVVLRADEERNGGLVETPTLPVPFLDGVESALARQVEHEQDSDSVIANERQHVDEFPLTSKIPD